MSFDATHFRQPRKKKYEIHRTSSQESGTAIVGQAHGLRGTPRPLPARRKALGRFRVVGYFEK